MNSDTLLFVILTFLFLLFMLLLWADKKVNLKQEIRYKQWIMPVFALDYTVVMMASMKSVTGSLVNGYLKLYKMLGGDESGGAFYETWNVYFEVVIFNLGALLIYVILKLLLTRSFGRRSVSQGSFIGNIVDFFYVYEPMDNRWYIREEYGQAHTFVKTAFYVCCVLSGSAMFTSCMLHENQLISTPFFPSFALIIIAEIAFYLGGLHMGEEKSSLMVQTDKSRRITMYPLLRGPLRALLGDKLSAEGTTVNNSSAVSGSVEDILYELEKTGGHIGKNYAAFMRRKMETGLKPNMDYVKCGYDLASGKSLLFNTPFYDKLNPYIFYAMNRELLSGGKVLIVLGRHGTEEDLQQWSEEGMQNVTNIPGIWQVEVLSEKKKSEGNMPDIGIISRSGVHDLDIHKSNMEFLQKVSFVFIVEPSRLVTTAQIGLNLLIKCCGRDKQKTFCSVDRNCDGLVDALSHILMTNITEVSATEYPHGMSSYMCWTADDEYTQHRIMPGVTRYLGMGTELSMVALKNQVKNTIWYGGDAYPVKDARWIAKQYYYDLLDYAQLPANQENFEKCFQTSFNMCDERVSDYSYITVEDDRNNLFETRRNYATIAEKQGFVNVISSEYMLREYMASNTELFTADAKAIPYITADYARTKRNTILSICLQLCIDIVHAEDLERQMVMLNIRTDDPVSEIWSEMCLIFGSSDETDFSGNPVLCVEHNNGQTVRFEKDNTILFKREYSVETGKIESMYTIEDNDFLHIILEDLQHASYIAEQESQDVYIGTELKGHIYQKYLPGQFFTLNGKYYEMIHTTSDNRILVRRASDHIGGRPAYRQVRQYNIHSMKASDSMGALKTVNDIDIHYQLADFSVETPGYWKLNNSNDFDNGAMVRVNGIPVREYRNKQILKFDFSKMGDKFTDSVRMTLTNLLNETFVTLFADNHPFISAVTPGQYDAPLTYSLKVEGEEESSEKCIFIIEDSQLDIGLLIAVERNVNRIFQIISDYLAWNEERIEESIKAEEEPVEEKPQPEPINIYEETGTDGQKKKNFFGRIIDKIKGLFKRKKDKAAEVPVEEPVAEADEKPEEEPVAVDAEEEPADEAPEEEQVAEEKQADEEEPETPVQTESKVEVSEDE